MNTCFIDGQNLHFGLKKLNWKLDYKKFRVHLKDKFKVEKAYYYFGFIEENVQDLYENLQEAGFIVRFRSHNRKMISQKKGNVDTEIVFDVMKLLMDLEKEDREEKDKKEDTKENRNKEKHSKIILVSGDGDYFKLVKFLIEKERFEKLIYPSAKSLSSLYKKVNEKYKLEVEELRRKTKK